MTPLEAETVVAALGLDAILRGNPSWSLERQENAAAFGKRARAALLRFLGASEPDAEAEDVPEFDWDEASKLLQEVGEEQNEALFDALPDDIQDDVLGAATRAIGYLQEVLPRRVTKTTALDAVTPPEPFELDRFARMWMVAVDPMSAVRAMREGSLDMVMVSALAAMYPALYESVAAEGGLLDEAIAVMKARRGDKWDVTDDQDRQVKILIQADPIDFDLAADFAALTPAAPAPPGQPRGAKAIKPTDELLPGQKSA